MLPTLSPRQKAGLACALAMLLWVPMGVSHGDATLVTGHSTFYDGDVFSPCLASLAGLMRHRVMWFDEQVLVETYGGKGTYVYITETGAADPRTSQLYSEGVYYDFVDPNGAHWHIEEAFRIETFDASVNPNVPNVAVGASQNRTYVWIVELSAQPIYDEFAPDSGPNAHSYYNFLSLVDTCKMHRGQAFDREIEHTELNGQINEQNGHANDDEDHTHETFMVDIWVGKKPQTTIPIGATTVGPGWSSSWATTWGEAQVSATNTTPETNDGPNDRVPER